MPSVPFTMGFGGMSCYYQSVPLKRTHIGPFVSKPANIRQLPDLLSCHNRDSWFISELLEGTYRIYIYIYKYLGWFKSLVKTPISSREAFRCAAIVLFGRILVKIVKFRSATSVWRIARVRQQPRLGGEDLSLSFLNLESYLLTSSNGHELISIDISCYCSS